MTADGKSDHASLLAEPAVSGDDAVSVLSDSNSGMRLLALCQKVLPTDRLGFDQSLFENGLNSLSAASLAWWIEKEFHVRIRLSDILDNPTIKKLLRLIEAGNRNEREEWGPRPVDGLTHPNSIPLSSSQEQVWFLEKLHPQLNSYRFQALLNCLGALNADVLERSLNRLVSRHTILRTAFLPGDGETPRQEVRPYVPVVLPREDLRVYPQEARPRELQRRIEEELRRPFHLGRPPLIRWRLYQLDDGKYSLLHTEHHFLHDGWSYGVFLEELYATYAALLNGASLAIEPEPAQFADFALWQRERIASGAWDHQLDYWRRELAECPPPPSLPSERRLGCHRTFEGSQIRHPIPRSLWIELSQACSREGVTPFAWIQAAFHLFIHCYTGAEDFCTGTGFANRRDPRFHKMLGMAINTLPVRARFQGIVTFRDLLRRTQDAVRFALDNQELPFEIVVKDLNPGREANSNPFFNAFVACYDTAYPSFAQNGLEISSEDGISCGQVKFDLLALFIPGRHAKTQNSYAPAERSVPLLLWEFSSELFDLPSARCMLNHYLALLKSSIHEPDAPVVNLPFAGDEEENRIVAFGKGAERPPQCEKPLYRLIESVVTAAPNSVAIIAGETSMTYGELNIRANRLAHHLASRGLGEGWVAAVALPRGPDAIVCFLAILKAGGSYLPIDLRDPEDRIACLLRLAKAAVILTKSGLAASLPASIRKDEICFIEELAAGEECNLSIDVPPASPAYILFTSGSTGVPKGVIVPHRAVSRLVFGLPVVQLDSSEVLLHLAPLSFDASTFEIWGALLHGARLVVSSEDLPDFRSLEETILRHGVTTAWLTSSLFNQIIDTSPEILRGLRQILTGGEALSPSHVRRALDLVPGARIVNGYGPTETTTFATLYELPRNFDEKSRAVPIGRPIAGTQVYVIRKSTPGERPCLAPIGAPGELYIGGEGVAIGYLDLPELTADRFVTDPFCAERGGRFYKTGDLVRWQPDGNLDFLGRIDDQLKIRGFRIEPGEIQAALERHPSVARAVARMWEPAPGEKRLTAYYQAKNGAPIDPADLRNLLSRQLPGYMIPATLIRMEKLPLTPAGKVDWRNLPQPDSPPASETHAPPRNLTEERLAALWCRLLNLESVGVHENFFELGGHSLIAMQIFSYIRREFRVEIPLRVLFESPTIDGLARQINGSQASYPAARQIEELLGEVESLSDESVERAIVEMGEIASYPFGAPEVSSDESVFSGFSCPTTRSRLFGARECNLAIVINDRFEIRGFERVADYVRELDPSINAVVSRDRHPMDLSLPKGPTLIFSPALIRNHPPVTGRLFCGYPLSKSEEYARLEKAGIPVPKWALLSEGSLPDLSEFDDYLVQKPDHGARGAEVKIVRKNRVKWRPVITRSAGLSSSLILQQFIYTGPRPVCYRVNTLFGKVLYSSRYKVRDDRPAMRGPNDFRTGGISIVASAQSSKTELSYEEDIIRLGEYAHSAFPEIPLLGFDIVREVPSGKLFVLEANAIGYTWIFYPAQPISYGFNAEQQFDGVRKAAYILAEKTQQSAL